MSKRETVEEFLKRGGQITKIVPQPTPDDEQKVLPTTGAGNGLMTLAEGSLFYAEVKPKVRKKAEPIINLAALPASLLKFVRKQNKDN